MPPRAVPCDICGQMFFPASLKFHQKTCREKQEKAIIQCPYCGIELPQGEMDAHLRKCKAARATLCNTQAREVASGVGSSVDAAASVAALEIPSKTADGRTRCQFCGRGFSADRIHKHISICAKLKQARPKAPDGTTTQAPPKVYNPGFVLSDASEDKSMWTMSTTSEWPRETPKWSSSTTSPSTSSSAKARNRSASREVGGKDRSPGLQKGRIVSSGNDHSKMSGKANCKLGDDSFSRAGKIAGKDRGPQEDGWRSKRSEMIEAIRRAKNNARMMRDGTQVVELNTDASDSVSASPPNSYRGSARADSSSLVETVPRMRAGATSGEQTTPEVAPMASMGKQRAGGVEQATPQAVPVTSLGRQRIGSVEAKVVEDRGPSSGTTNPRSPSNDLSRSGKVQETRIPSPVMRRASAPQIKATLPQHSVEHYMPMTDRPSSSAHEVAEEWEAGSRVKVKGLSGASHLNGQMATLINYDSDAKCWLAMLNNGDVKALRAEHIVAAGAAESPRKSANQVLVATTDASKQAWPSNIPKPSTPKGSSRPASATRVPVTRQTSKGSRSSASLGARRPCPSPGSRLRHVASAEGAISSRGVRPPRAPRSMSMEVVKEHEISQRTESPARNGTERPIDPKSSPLRLSDDPAHSLDADTPRTCRSDIDIDASSDGGRSMRSAASLPAQIVHTSSSPPSPQSRNSARGHKIGARAIDGISISRATSASRPATSASSRRDLESADSARTDYSNNFVDHMAFNEGETPRQAGEVSGSSTVRSDVHRPAQKMEHDDERSIRQASESKLVAELLHPSIPAVGSKAVAANGAVVSRSSTTSLPSGAATSASDMDVAQHVAPTNSVGSSAPSFLGTGSATPSTARAALALPSHLRLPASEPNCGAARVLGITSPTPCGTSPAPAPTLLSAQSRQSHTLLVPNCAPVAAAWAATAPAAADSWAPEQRLPPAALAPQAHSRSCALGSSRSCGSSAGAVPTSAPPAGAATPQTSRAANPMVMAPHPPASLTRLFSGVLPSATPQPAAAGRVVVPPSASAAAALRSPPCTPSPGTAKQRAAVAQHLAQHVTLR